MAAIDFQPIEFKEEGAIIDFQPVDFQEENAEPSFFGKMARYAQGALEIPLAAATGALAYPSAKIAGLAQYAMGRGRERAEQAEQETASRIQYQPQTPEGRAGVNALMKIPEAMAGFGKEATRLIGESWGVSEEAMYIPEMVGEAAGVLATPKAFRAGKQALSDNIVTAPVKATARAIGGSNIPEELYARTMKIPPGSLRTEGRGNVIETMVRNEQLPLGSKTAGKMTERIQELDTGINEALRVATDEGGVVDVGKVAAGLKNFKANYKNRPDAKKYYDAIDEVRDQLLQHAFVNKGQMTVTDAHALKKGIYAEIQDFYAKGQKPETGRMGIKNDVEAAAKAEAAKLLRSEILGSELVPGKVKIDLEREAGLMNARKWVERATNRGGNLDPISMSGMMFGILVDGGVSKAVAWRAAASQPVMSRLAIGLAKLGEKKTVKAAPFERWEFAPPGPGEPPSFEPTPFEDLPIGLRQDLRYKPEKVPLSLEPTPFENLPIGLRQDLRYVSPPKSFEPTAFEDLPIGLRKNLGNDIIRKRIVGPK